MGFFDFGTSISRQGVNVLTRARDLEGVRLGLGVLANNIKVRLSLIRGRSSKAEGVRGARGARGARGGVKRGAKGRRFRGIFSFNISYLRRES